MKKFLTFMLAMFLTNSAFSATPDYSESVTAGNFVYVSAQLPIDPLTGQIVQGDMITLTNLLIDHIQHQLHIKGLTLRQVIKTEVYLTDVRDFPLMDSAYGARFHFSFPPARDVVVAANLLNNSPIQISCIAYALR